MGGTIGDPQGIQTAARVADELLSHRTLGRHAPKPEAHEASAVGGAAVVDVDHGRLVHTVA